MLKSFIFPARGSIDRIGARAFHDRKQTCDNSMNRSVVPRLLVLPGMPSGRSAQRCTAIALTVRIVGADFQCTPVP